jgi:hypothetical protein
MLGMKKIKFNENFFEEIDCERKSYYLGFITADGCVANRRNQLTIKINSKDINLLNNFIEDINYEGEIWFSKERNICQVALSSSKLIKDLSNTIHTYIPVRI